MLSDEIRQSTKAPHDKSNRLASIKLGFALRDPKVYREFLHAFAQIYFKFENSLDELLNLAGGSSCSESTRVALEYIHKPQFRRSDRLKKDLDFYFDGETELQSTLLKENTLLREYTTSITRHIAQKPHVVVAYVHTMYLGLFAGGRIVRAGLAKRLKLGPYAFSRQNYLAPPQDGSELQKTQEELLDEETERERAAEEVGLQLFLWDDKPEYITQKQHEDSVRDVVRWHIDKAGANLASHQRQDIIEEANYIFMMNERLISSIRVSAKVPYKLYLQDMLYSFWFWWLLPLLFLYCVVYYRLHQAESVSESNS